MIDLDAIGIEVTGTACAVAPIAACIVGRDDERGILRRDATRLYTDICACCHMPVVRHCAGP